MYQDALPNLEAAVKEFRKNIEALSKVKTVDQISQYEMAALGALHTAQLSVGGLAHILQDATQRARVNANQIATAELLATVKQSTRSSSNIEKLSKKSTTSSTASSTRSTKPTSVKRKSTRKTSTKKKA